MIAYGSLRSSQLIVILVAGTPIDVVYAPRELPPFPVLDIKPITATCWERELWQTPRRTKRGLPAMKPAPRQVHRRACY